MELFKIHMGDHIPLTHEELQEVAMKTEGFLHHYFVQLIYVVIQAPILRL